MDRYMPNDYSRDTSGQSLYISLAQITVTKRARVR